MLSAMMYSPGDEFFGFSICFVYILFFIIWIMIAVWVYKDAESRGMEGAIWLVVVLVAGIIGLLIYLLLRKDKIRHPQYGYYPYPPGPQQPYNTQYPYYGQPYSAQYPYYGQPPKEGERPPRSP